MPIAAFFGLPNPSNLTCVDYLVYASMMPMSGLIPSEIFKIPDGIPEGSGKPGMCFTFQRQQVLLVYPFLVLFGFWGITASLCVLLWTHVFAARIKVNSSLIAMFVALIFAMPSLRDSATISPFGSRFDFLGFFWAELTALLGCALLSFKYFVDEEPEDKE
jgi:hypothetical protein